MKNEKIKAQVEFRHELLESQKRTNYMNEFDRRQRANKLPGLDTKSKEYKTYKRWLVNHLKEMAIHIEFILQNFQLNYNICK